jgi:hypothetical protein
MSSGESLQQSEEQSSLAAASKDKQEGVMWGGSCDVDAQLCELATQPASCGRRL